MKTFNYNANYYYYGYYRENFTIALLRGEKG